MASPRSEFTSGSKAMLPILPGLIPFATISGIATVETGIPAHLALAFSVISYSGTAQMAAVQLIGAGTSAIVVVLTALVINLRFAMYSASIAPHLRELSARWKRALAYLLADQAYAVSITRFAKDPGRANKHWFFLGAALTIWGTWQAGTIVGIFLGARVPESWSLDFAIPLTFIAVLVPAIREHAALVAAGAAGLISILAADLPFNLGIIVATTGGILAGMLVELRKNRAQG